MKHISLASIEKAIQKVDNLDEDGLERIAETYALAQQTLLGYVLSAAIEYENEQLFLVLSLKFAERSDYSIHNCF